MQMDINMQSDVRDPTASIQQVVDHTVSAALTAVDERVEMMIGAVEAAANRVEGATTKQRNPRRSDKHSATDDDYDGDVEFIQRKPRGHKSPRVNKQHVRIHHMAFTITYLF